MLGAPHVARRPDVAHAVPVIDNDRDVIVKLFKLRVKSDCMNETPSGILHCKANFNFKLTLFYIKQVCRLEKSDDLIFQARNECI